MSPGLDEIAGLARLALTAWWHTTEFVVKSSLRAPGYAAELARSPHRAIDLARGLLETAAGEPATPSPGRSAAAEPSANGRPEPGASVPPSSLREEGEVLLRKSRDVRYEIDAHPAYERILSELAPDEARVLRLLLLDGPQPSVDIRTGGPVGMVRSRLVAPGLSMIGARAGCRYVERVPSYLNNLFRLGLIWFSRETIRDPLRYQVLEAQPDVLEAIQSVRQAKVVRRSIHLTPFGEDFCRICLSTSADTLDALPHHSAPKDTGVVSQPPAESVET